MADGFTATSTSDYVEDAIVAHSDALLEQQSCHSGATEPTVKVGGMLWRDTSTTTLKIWDSTNAAWRVILADYEAAQGGIPHLDSATFTAAVGYDGVAVATGANHFAAASQMNSLVQSMVFEVTLANSSHNHFLWAIPAAGKYGVTEVYVISDTATTGSDGSNNWAFQVRNLTTAEDLCSSAATTNGSEIAADTRFAIGVDQNNAKADLAGGGEVLELQITKTGTPTDLSSAKVAIQVDYTVAMF